MSANELLQQLKALPPREREKFFQAVDEFETESAPGKSRKKQKRVEWPDVLERAKKICGNRVLPNMVLLEREESRY